MLTVGIKQKHRIRVRQEYYFLCLPFRPEAPLFNTGIQGFPGGALVENLPANAGDTGSSPGLGRSHMPRSN